MKIINQIGPNLYLFHQNDVLVNLKWPSLWKKIQYWQGTVETINNVENRNFWIEFLNQNFESKFLNRNFWKSKFFWKPVFRVGFQNRTNEWRMKMSKTWIKVGSKANSSYNCHWHTSPDIFTNTRGKWRRDTTRGTQNEAKGEQKVIISKTVSPWTNIKMA